MQFGSYPTWGTFWPSLKRRRPMRGGGTLAAAAELGFPSSFDRQVEASTSHQPPFTTSSTLREASPLALLPRDIQANVLGCLQIQDRLRFRSVCRYWRSAPPASRAPLPWLLTHAPSPAEAKHRTSIGEPLVMGFYSPWENRMYEIRGLVGAEGCREVVGSSPDGTWIMYVDGDEKLCGVCVSSGERVRGPPIEEVTGDYALCTNGKVPEQGGERRWSRFCRALIIFHSSSSCFPPVDHEGVAHRRAPKFTIVAICRDGPKEQRSNQIEALVFARDGDDSWTDIHPRGITCLRHMMFHQDSLYVANDNGDVLRVDGLLWGGTVAPISTPLPSWTPHVPPWRVEIPTETSTTTITPLLPRMAYLKQTTYLAGFGGDVYQVWGSPYRAVFTSSTAGVGFARLDSWRNKWDDQIREVGSYATFLGNGHPLVYSTWESRQLSSGRICLGDGSEFRPPMMFGKLHEPAWGDGDRPQPTWVVHDLR